MTAQTFALFGTLYVAAIVLLFSNAPEGFETPGVGFRFGKPGDYDDV